MAVIISLRFTLIPVLLVCLLQAFLISFSVSFPFYPFPQPQTPPPPQPQSQPQTPPPPQPQSQPNLIPNFYTMSCPMVEQIVKSVVENAVMKEARMGASLLRLHFHDCFVKGCDASLLLDDSPSIVSEKRAHPNKNSARGFEVIDQIKSELEKACPRTVSCADILAISARDAVVLSGGPSWEVLLGRRDSTNASLSGSDDNIPAPNSTLQTLITKFKLHGLNEIDLVALSGAHTIGQSRCTNFRQRLYNQSGNEQPDITLDKSFLGRLISMCPKSGGDDNLSPLDLVSPTKFDNYYFKNLVNGQGLLASDEQLYTMDQGKAKEIVKAYAQDEALFLRQFAESMVKLGNISPLTGNMGEIRVNCRSVLS